jgi:hypothetical protein
LPSNGSICHIIYKCFLKKIFYLFSTGCYDWRPSYKYKRVLDSCLLVTFTEISVEYSASIFRT